MKKLFIILILFISVWANAKTKYPSFLNGASRVSIDTIKEVTASLTKKESYEIYLNDCNTIVKDTIRESGYINFDTIRVSSIPEDMMYFNKPVIKSVQLSNGIANIIVADTTWNVIRAPEYRSTWEYYILAKNQMPKSNKINPDYSNKIMVFRMKVYTWKKRKPLTFEDWDANISTTSNYPEIH
jgi:hypothetical protein